MVFFDAHERESRAANAQEAEGTMTRASLLVAITGSLLLTPARAQAGEKTPLPAEKLGEFQQCSRDADCVYAQNGCCDCANGGQETAVNKKRLDDFTKLFDCARVGCTQKGSVPPCGSGVVACVSGACTYSKPASASATVSINTPDPYPFGNKRYPPVWTQTINQRHAQSIIVHFAQFFLPPGDSLTVYNSKSVALASFSGRGPEDGQEFWGPLVPGESVKLVLRAGPKPADAPAGTEKYGVLIDSYTYLEEAPPK